MSTQTNQKIIIVGAGLAGLALAQGFLKHCPNTAFTIYERDTAASYRAQGYRIRISPEGGAALRHLLPDSLWEAFEASCGCMVPGFVPGGHQIDALNGQPTQWARRPGGGPGTMPGGKVWNADRAVLRGLLMRGLEGRLEFARRCVGFESVTQGVRAMFADGPSDVGSILVGADGVWSPVRRQLMPDFELLDTGTRAVFGKTPITDSLFDKVPGELGQGICLIGENQQAPVKLFCDIMRFDHAAASGLHVDVPTNYVYWVLLFPHLALQTEDRQPLRGMSGSQSAQLSQDLTSAWNLRIRTLLGEQEPASASTLTVQTSTPATLERALAERIKPNRRDPRVVLIGDCAHPMPPVGGVGANAAFQDAAELCDVLVRHALDETEWFIDGLRGFEEGVHGRVKIAVERSLGAAGSMFGMKAVVDMKPAVLAT